MSINRVCISGNLTREPELRQTPAGADVMKFCVAVNEGRKNRQSGEWEQYAHFVDCTMFGKRAGALHKYLHKGERVAIEGRLNYSSWTDKNTGAKRNKLDVIVDEVVIMQQAQGAQNGAQGAYNAPQAQGMPQAQPVTQYAQQAQQGANMDGQAQEDLFGDEIPF